MHYTVVFSDVGQCGFIIISELHQFGLAKMGGSQKSLRGFIESFGYFTFGLTNARALPRFFPAATLIQHPFIINLLFSTPAWVGEYWPTAVFDQCDPC